MLDTVRPDFVLALGRHSAMAETALELIARDLPFLMEKPLGLNAAEVGRVAAKAHERNAFVAVPLDRWQRGDPPAAGVDDALRAAKLIDRAYEPAATGS